MPKLPSFVELPAFERNRETYLKDDRYKDLQNTLMGDPEAGAVIKGTGGLRKLRFEDTRRNKGKRGGLRVIYYYKVSNVEFLMFTLYDKDEASDLSAEQKKSLKQALERELSQRYKKNS